MRKITSPVKRSAVGSALVLYWDVFSLKRPADAAESLACFAKLESSPVRRAFCYSFVHSPVDPIAIADDEVKSLKDPTHSPSTNRALCGVSRLFRSIDDPWSCRKVSFKLDIVPISGCACWVVSEISRKFLDLTFIRVRVSTGSLKAISRASDFCAFNRRSSTSTQNQPYYCSWRWNLDVGVCYLNRA